MKDKKSKRNLVALFITIVLINLMTTVMQLKLDKYQLSCTYMLLYLCINEVLKEN